MNANIIRLWDDNKELLRNYIANTRQEEYKEYLKLVKLVVKFILNGGKEDFDYESFDVDNITEVNNGDYQGTLIYLIPLSYYQPSASNYIVTFADYGSCSGCDSLQAIRYYQYEEELPCDKQIKDYMTLCLHLVQKMKYLYDAEEIY
jgi:hypothetical protein